MLCSDVCCIAEIILQRPIGSALYWAWLVKVLSGLLPDCLSICPGSAYCPCCPLILGRLFLEPQKPRDNRTHDNRPRDNNSPPSSLLQKSEYEYALDHVGGIRCCESNESPQLTHFGDSTVNIKESFQVLFTCRVRICSVRCTCYQRGVAVLGCGQFLPFIIKRIFPCSFGKVLVKCRQNVANKLFISRYFNPVVAIHPATN